MNQLPLNPQQSGGNQRTSSAIPLNGERLTSHLTRLLGAGTTTADSGGFHRLLSTGSGGNRTGYRVAQEIPDDSTLEHLNERPANLAAKALREFN